MAICDRYLIDSDVLIGAQNGYYNNHFCKAFWEWLEQGHRGGLFFSIDKVKEEIKKGDKEDFLVKWINKEDLNSFFLDSKTCLLEYSRILNWANEDWTKGKDRNKTRKALENISAEHKADAWLVAYAIANKFMIVTNEVSSKDSLTNIKLPDIAEAFNIKAYSLHKLLVRHATDNFRFKKS